jgi:hypothetical protein
MLSDESRLEAQHKLAAGRILASRKMPYFTTALMAISPFEREGLGTFAVDKRWRMYYDPQKCLEYTVLEICAVWLHEVGHLIRSHSKRFAELEGFNHDPRIFNCAGDAAINSDLRDSDIILPNPEKRYYAESNPEFPEWERGMTAEEMYFIGWRKQGNLPPDESASGANKDAEKEEGDSNSEESNETSSDSTEEAAGPESNDAESDDSEVDDTKEDNNESSQQAGVDPNDDEDDTDSSDDDPASDSEESDSKGDPESDSLDGDPGEDTDSDDTDGDDTADSGQKSDEASKEESDGESSAEDDGESDDSRGQE